MTIKIGDTVCLRGDLRRSYVSARNPLGQCAYFPEQLVDGKYLRHTGTGEVWTGKVNTIHDDMAKIGGGWWNIRLLEVAPCKP